MGTTRTITHYALIIGTIYGISIIALTLIITGLGGTVVGATAPAYNTFPGNLIVATPTEISTITPGDTLLTNPQNPIIGTYINHTTVDNYNLITIKTGYEDNNINAYTAPNTVQKILFQIPLLGLLPGLLAQNLGLTITLIPILIIVSLLYFFVLNKKPLPPKYENTSTDQIKVLQTMFHNAPEPPARKKTVK